MSLLTREDALRELELLPVWQLRTPAAEAVKASEEMIENATEISPPISTPITISALTLSHIASDNGDYLFVLPSATMPAEEAQLFQNICKAMRVQVKPAQPVTGSLDEMRHAIKALQPKMLVCMGEAAAQALLQSVTPLESLRGQAHPMEGMALIATYDLTHLLHNLHHKAKTWDDLCIALRILQVQKTH